MSEEIQDKDEELSGEDLLAESMAEFDELDDALESTGDEEDNPELDEIASKDGYMTKEEWVASGKDPEDYMTKEEFAKVGQLRDSGLSKQNLSKKFVQVESALNELMKGQKDIITRAREDERKKTIEELRSKQKEAIDFQDTSEALRLEKEINKVESAPEKAEAQVDPTVESWYQEHKVWYDTIPEAKALVNMELAKGEKAGEPFSVASERALKRVKKAMPYLFDDEEPVHRPVSRNETGVRRPKAPQTGKKRFADLGDDTLISIAKKAAKAAGMTETEYMEQMQ